MAEGYSFCYTLPMAPSRLGRTIKRLRLARGLTQVDLAKRARISQAFVAQLETGARPSVTVPYAVRLAKALGVELGELVK
jgi:transcriptional regulator with XRE-family HTH domain